MPIDPSFPGGFLFPHRTFVQSPSLNQCPSSFDPLADVVSVVLCEDEHKNNHNQFLGQFMRGYTMLPQSFIEQANLKQQDFERTIKQRKLVRQALIQPQKSGIPYQQWLSHLGGWLISQGERIEAHYRLDETPIRSLESPAEAC
jgi:hypothetical protein